MTYRPNDDRGNLEWVPEDSLLPPELHEEAAAVRKAEDRLEDREDALAEARGAVHPAKLKDAEELKAAVLEDKKLPPPNKHRIAAEAALRQEEEAHRIAVSERRRLGNVFIRRLREHRAYIAERAAERLAPAVEEYATAVDEAAKRVELAAAKVMTATEALHLVRDLDSGERYVSMAPMGVPTLDTGKLRERARVLQEAAEGLSTPAAPKTRRVRSANGTEMTLPVAMVRDKLRKGELDPDEPFLDGLPPEAPAPDPATLPKDPLRSTETQFGRSRRAR